MYTPGFLQELHPRSFFLVYDGGMNVVLIDYRETIMTEDMNEQMTDDRIREKGKRSCFYPV